MENLHADKSVVVVEACVHLHSASEAHLVQNGEKLWGQILILKFPISGGGAMHSHFHCPYGEVRMCPKDLSALSRDGRQKDAQGCKGAAEKLRVTLGSCLHPSRSVLLLYEFLVSSASPD